MAIAFDTSLDGGFQTGVTVADFSYTCGASATFLFVFMFSNTTGSGADKLTGVTYNSVAMTKIGSSISTPNDLWASAWGLLNPATGSAHNIEATASSVPDAGLGCAAASYSGAGNVEASAPNTATAPAASITGTVTTITANAWTVAGFINDSGAFTAGGGTTLRVAGTDGLAIGDSNAALSAGSHTLTATDSINNPNWGVMIISLPPSGGSAPVIMGQACL